MNHAFSKIWIIVIIVASLVAIFWLGIGVWNIVNLQSLYDEIRGIGEEEESPAVVNYNKENIPHFEDFPVFDEFKGTPTPVDLSSHSDAPGFKTRLTEGISEGPNFAGHYTVITWGCGTMCEVAAVVDAQTGVIYFPPFITELGSEFRIDSNLFIVNPPNTIEEVFGGFDIPDWVYTAYYKWENNQFINIYDTRTAGLGIYSEEEAKRIIESRAAEAISAIKNKNMERLSGFVHPDKGIRFSPYAYVRPDEDIIFSAAQVLNFFEDQTVYTWGVYDGIGTPINSIPEEYYNEFIYDKNFVNAEEISYNRPLGKGNTINNSSSVYPDAIIVEYYFSGFDPKFAGLDWKSLKLVFEAENNTWYLVGIIHDQWTI